MSLKLDYFSAAGKSLAEKPNIKYEKRKRILGKDIFTPDKNWQMNNYLYNKEQIEKECNFNIDEIKKSIKKNYIDKKKKREIKKENEEEDEKDDKIYKKIFQGFKYKYHNIHVSKIEKYKKRGLLAKFNIQRESLYHPKYEYLYHKIITGPKWSDLTYRKKNLFNDQNYISNLSYNDTYLNKEIIKGFVDMSKQTKRKGMIEENTKSLDKDLNFNFRTSLNIKKEHPFLLLITKENDGIIMNNENESDLIKYKDLKRNISGPDFNRYLSRDNLNDKNKKKERIINGDLSPNYNSIESSTKMMVFYKKSRNHKLKDNRDLNYFSSNITYDANKTFEKIYGNKYKVVPNFGKMTPRKYNKLPFFLNGLTNRNIYITNTEKSLKMNNYSNSKMYNLCGDMKMKINKYKNNKIANMRHYYSFENIKMFNKKRILNELKEKIKKFNRLVINNEIKNNDYN